MEWKLRKKNLGPGVGLEETEKNENDTDKNMNTGMTGKTVTNPGEGLSEHFNVNTFGSNSS